MMSTTTNLDLYAAQSCRDSRTLPSGRTGILLMARWLGKISSRSATLATSSSGGGDIISNRPQTGRWADFVVAVNNIELRTLPMSENSRPFRSRVTEKSGTTGPDESPGDSRNAEIYQVPYLFPITSAIQIPRPPDKINVSTG
jgi:hypothetical protein